MSLHLYLQFEQSSLGKERSKKTKHNSNSDERKTSDTPQGHQVQCLVTRDHAAREKWADRVFKGAKFVGTHLGIDQVFEVPYEVVCLARLTLVVDPLGCDDDDVHYTTQN